MVLRLTSREAERWGARKGGDLSGEFMEGQRVMHAAPSWAKSHLTVVLLVDHSSGLYGGLAMGAAKMHFGAKVR